jgi:DNA-binding transcriptional MerR regulator/methylmalonyl-CoA mutase cobalamin-binding subunit
MSGTGPARGPRHPIRIVVQRTGLTADVLRAWEKRYGVVRPGRSETGRRLYTDADVERLRLLRRLTEAGRSIGQVAQLSTAALSALLEEDEAERAPSRAGGTGAETRERDDATEYVAAALGAVRRLDAVRLDAVLVRAALRLGVPAFLEDVAAVLMREIGEGWHGGTLRPSHEHLASAVLRRVLGWLQWTGAADGRRGVLVVATPQGQRHEMGGLLCAAAAVSEGWRVVYLGADLPAEDIARTVVESGAHAVALSLVYPAGDAGLAAELRRLRAALPAAVSILAGGRGAESYASVLREVEAVRLPDLDALRATLRAMSESPPSPNGPEAAD